MWIPKYFFNFNNFLEEMVQYLKKCKGANLFGHDCINSKSVKHNGRRESKVDAKRGGSGTCGGEQGEILCEEHMASKAFMVHESVPRRSEGRHNRSQRLLPPISGMRKHMVMIQIGR